MSIRLKDTIYDIINNSDKLDGYHRNNLYTSIPAWITATELSKGITVEGDSDKFYPVVISVSSSKEMPTFISIQKDLGTKTPSLSGNHSNGTSSLWLRYEMRNTMWDGNGGYIKTWYKYQGYATLVAHTRTNTKSHGGLIVWLRGGSCSYTISCTNSFNVNIYYSSTNIGSSDHPDNVAPMTSVDNGGIYTSTTLGYGNISGNASTATSAGKLTTARTISLTGSVTGSGSFDGSGNLSIATTTNHTHNYASTVKVGSTSYNSSSNVISLPAYPTVPTSLKCPNSLTIKLNGTSQGAWDGSSAKTIDITYSSVGAASSGHNHDSVYAAKSHTHTTIVGSYTSNGGQQNPNYFGTNKVGALMMNTTVNSNTHYKDWLFMDCYSGNDVGGAVAIGVNRQALGVYIMRSAAARTSWAESAELLGTHNWSSYCAAKSHTHNYAGSSSAGGAATSANKLATARKITLSGSVTGSASFDGSAAITISTTTNHTHNYAGSSSAGGAATSANKLNTNAGGATTPVYFTGGVPTACSVASTAATASTIAVRDGSGDIYARLIRQTYADQSTISGGIVYRVNNSSDNYLRVCNSASAIRSFIGAPSTSDLGAYLPRRRMTNPEPGHASIGAIPLILALKAAGTPVYGDPEFKDGVNNCYVYNNSGNSTVTITRISDNQNSGNSSGKILQISSTTGTASPGRGGFYQNISARAGAVFCQIFRAKIPTGFSVVNAENSMGANYKTYWMTDTAGTGKWEWYCRITSCGTSGTMSSGGHVYLSGSGAVTWYLSYCNLIDLTKGNYDGLRAIYSDTATKLGSNAGSATNPIYFSGGKPVACTYSLNKTVPSDAKFTDTNTTYSAGSGLSLSGTTFNHASSVTAGTAGTSSATSGSTLAVPYVTVNATGHVTGYGTHTHTVSGFAASSHSHSSLTCNYNGGVKSNPQEYFSNTIGLKVAMTGHWSQWSDTLWVNGYSGGDVKSMCALHFLRNGTPRMGISTQQNTATSYGTIYEVITGYNIANQSVNYANSAGSVAWGNITGKPSTFAPSSHNHNYLKGGPDNRSTNNSPSWYMTNLGAASIYTEFCQSGGANGNYENRTTFIPWGDQSGQRPVQLAFNNSGMFIRTAASDTAWNGWSGFSLAGHTHKYAGSSSAGGDANNSVKWGGYKIVVGSTGTATDTIYFIT